MPNAMNIFNLLEQLQSDSIEVHQNRCVAVRNRNACCNRCVTACTTGCLSYQENEICIVQEKCIGCGTCATACPTGALEAREPDDDALFRACRLACEKNDGAAILVCRHMLEAAEGSYDPEKVVGLACLGRMEESLLIALAQEGVSRISLVQGQCSSCENVACLHIVTEVCDTANTLLEAWGRTMRVSLVERMPSSVKRSTGDKHDVQRRSFFSEMKREAKHAADVGADYAVKEVLGVEPEADPAFVKVAEDGTLPHFIPERRASLLERLGAWGEPDDVMISSRLWGHVVIDEGKCSSCQMCATFCPTGALSKFQRPGGSFGLEHSPGICVACQCCADICRESALSLSKEVFATDLLNGVVERFDMKPRKNPPGNPHQIWHSMKDLIGADQIYER